MSVIHYAQATESQIAAAFGVKEFPEGVPGIWHFASLDGESFNTISYRPSNRADLEALEKYAGGDGGTVPMGYARVFVERVSDRIEKIEI